METKAIAWDRSRPALFTEEYGHSRNFISPDVIGYVTAGTPPYVAIELSSGEGILNRDRRIWGVSVVRRLPDGRTTRHSLDGTGENESRACHSRQEAEAHAATVLARDPSTVKP